MLLYGREDCEKTVQKDRKERLSDRIFLLECTYKKTLSGKIWSVFVGGGGFWSYLFKICSFCLPFLVDFEVVHCENTLTLGIVCD